MEEEEDLLRAQLPKSLESNAKRSFTVTLSLPHSPSSLLSPLLISSSSSFPRSVEFYLAHFRLPLIAPATTRELPSPQCVMDIMSAARLEALLVLY